jgi:hypothetical protein
MITHSIISTISNESSPALSSGTRYESLISRSPHSLVLNDPFALSVAPAYGRKPGGVECFTCECKDSKNKLWDVISTIPTCHFKRCRHCGFGCGLIFVVVHRMWLAKKYG